MKALKKKIILYLTFMTLILVLISLAVSLWLPKLYITPVYLYILAFFYLVTLAILFILGKSMHTHLSRFANTYMIVNFIKLVFFSLIIAAYAYLFKENVISFVISFFVYYVLYSFFEVVALRQMNDQEK